MKRAILLLALSLGACGTSPEPDYYDLASVGGSPLSSLELSIKIQRPSLPDYLDRPDIVREETAYQYAIDDMHRWAEPLDRMFERILTEDLRQRLPGCRIVSESDTGTVDLRYAIETDIEQFNAAGKDRAVLKASLSIDDKTKVISTEPQSIELTSPSGTSPQDLAAALSDLIGEYADRVQAALVRLPVKDR